MSLTALDAALDVIAKHNPSNDSVTLMLGDCLHLMADMPDKSVHLIITDPPYFIDGMDSGWDVAVLNNKKSKAGIVGGLPTGMKFDPKQGRDLQEFYTKVAGHVMRVLCPGGFFLSFSSPRLYHRMAVAMEDVGFEIRDMYAWYYSQSQQKAFKLDHFVDKMNLSKAGKKALIKSMGGRKTPQLRPQFEPIVIAQKPKDGTFINNWTKWQTGLVDFSTRINGGIPTTVLQAKKPIKERYNSHLTVKPISLIETFIKLFSVEGQIILDPFVGSGTTLLAARNTKRLSVGMEINKEYYRICQNRLEGKL